MSDIRELEASLARQIYESAISTPEYGQNPWDTKPVVDAYHRRCFEKTIARLEATWSSGDLAISEDQSAGKHHANPSCGPVAGADVGLCCVDMATTSREAVASGECPTVDVVPSPSILPCMAFASGIAVRGCDGFSSPDPTALSLNSSSTLPPVWKASPSTHTVPPLWTAPPVQLASPEHTDLIIDQQTDRTQTTTLDNQLQNHHVRVTAAQLERHYPPAKAAPPERRTAPTDPRMHDASQKLKKGYGLVQDASQKTRPRRVQEVLPKTGYLLVRGASTAWYPPVQGAPLKKAAVGRVSEGAESTAEDRGSVGAGYTADRATTVDGSVTDMGPVGTPDRSSAGTQIGDPPAPQTEDPQAWTEDPPAWTGDPPAQTGDPPAPHTEDPLAPTEDPPVPQTEDPSAWTGDPPAQTGDPPVPLTGDPPAPQTEDPPAIQTENPQARIGDPPAWTEDPPTPTTKDPPALHTESKQNVSSVPPYGPSCG
ncbi:mucin-2-like [Asterias rubens]|uniref:mucin-2-like n=1 Tax=Asterias rubens TaxID=7604 RepID=UPI001455BE44|nr:mucin-2-like [Asterias rubens]